MDPNRRLPDDKREYFKKQLGKELKESELQEIDAYKPLITVGDVVSLTLRKHGIVPDISIYDGMTERHEMTEFADLVKREGWEETVVVNAAGTISSAMVSAIRNALSGRKEIIRVEGEEDLATIPCILFAPEGTNIIYGWPGKGMMIITTDDSIKREAQLLISMMEEYE